MAIEAPGVTASGLSGFLEGLRQGAALRAQREASDRADMAEALHMANAEQQRRLNEVNLADAVAARDREAAGRKFGAAYALTPSPVTTIAPERPAEPSPEVAALQPGEDPALAATLPGPRPARPAVTVSAPTFDTVRQAAETSGVDLAAALGSHAGQQALRARPPLSPEQWEQRQRQATARQEWSDALGEVGAAYKAADAVKAAEHEMRASRAAIEAGIDPQGRELNAAFARYSKLTEARRTESKELEAMNRELPPVAEAIEAYGEHPDWDTESAVWSAAMKVTSKLGAQHVERLLRPFAARVAMNRAKGYVHRDISAFDEATGTIYEGLVDKGAPIGSRQTWVDARRQAAELFPEGAAKILESAAHDPKGQLSELDAEALLGEPPGSRTTKDSLRLEAARNVSAKRPDLVPGSDPWHIAVSDEETALYLKRHPSRSTGLSPEDTRDLRLRDREYARANALGRELTAIDKQLADRSTDKKLRPTLQARREQVAIELEDRKATALKLDEALAARGAPIQTGRSDAAGASLTPGVDPPPGSGVDPKRAIPPPPALSGDAYRAAMKAELQRLVQRQGHTVESGKAAMRQVNWQ